MFRIFTIILISFLVFSTSFAQNTEGVEWEWVIQPQFDDAWFFFDGLASVKQNNKWGFIDKTGKIVIQPQFESFGYFLEGLLPIKQNGKYGYIDKFGKIAIEPQFDYADSFSEGFAYISQNGKYGFIDKTGRIVIQPQFLSGGIFKEGLAKVRLQNDKLGFIDKTGRVVIQSQFNIEEDFYGGLAKITKNGKYGFIDKTGRIVIQPQFSWAARFSENLAVIGQNNKYGYIDRTGNIVISPQFDDAIDFTDGLARIRQNNKYGFINRTGKIIIQPQFDEATEFGDGIAIIRQNNRCGFIDKTGKMFIQPQFAKVRGLCVLDKNGKWGFIKVIPKNNNNNYNNLTIKPKVWAVVIGVSNYSSDLNNQGVRNLKYADNDALKIKEFLKSPEGGQLPDEQIKILTNSAASKNSIINACRDIFWKSSEKDLVFFYFSGHGGVDVFLAHDDIIQISELKEIIYKSKAQRRFCVADACHAGSWDKNSDFAKKRLSAQETVDRYYQELERSGKGLGLFMASQRNETSIDDYELRQGLFTYYYIEGLKGLADTNSDGIVGVNELYTYVRKKVQDRASARWNNSQHPELHGNIDMNMPIGVTSH